MQIGASVWNASGEDEGTPTDIPIAKLVRFPANQRNECAKSVPDKLESRPWAEM